VTVEVRELVIQAKVISDRDEHIASPVQVGSVRERVHEERLIQLITRRVLERLRDEEWGRK
jgi:Family of unknown function (DUF5908)